MHLIPLVSVSSDPEAVADLLVELVSCAYPASVVLPPALAPSIDSDLAERMAASSLEWVRMGHTRPWFSMLPDSEISRQLMREEAVLRKLGVTPGPLWTTGPWTAHLPSSFVRAGVGALLLPGSSLDEVAAGVVSHLDAVLPVIPVVEPADLDALDEGRDTAVAVVVDTDDPVDAIRDLSRRVGCDVTTVQAFLDTHPPLGRRRPSRPDWDLELARDPDLGIIHRTLIRLASRAPERLSDEAEQALLEAESGSVFAGGEPLEAAGRLIEARHRIDRERRRGDDWARVTRLDWDADGSVETHIEMPELSMVLAPARSGAIPLLDLKPGAWPVSLVHGEPGWVLARLVADPETGIPTPVELTEASVTEMRGGAMAVELEGTVGRGRLAIHLEARESRVSIRYRIDGIAAGLIGPEMKLAFSTAPEIRVDGSEWAVVDQPRAVSGHKFRIADNDHHVLLSSLTPTDMFLRPGVDGRGLVAWPHWVTSGTGTYELTVDLAADG